MRQCRQHRAGDWDIKIASSTVVWCLLLVKACAMYVERFWICIILHGVVRICFWVALMACGWIPGSVHICGS